MNFNFCRQFFVTCWNKQTIGGFRRQCNATNFGRSLETCYYLRPNFGFSPFKEIAIPNCFPICKNENITIRATPLHISNVGGANSSCILIYGRKLSSMIGMPIIGVNLLRSIKHFQPSSNIHLAYLIYRVLTEK